MFWRSAVALIPIVIYLMILGQFPAALKTAIPMGHFQRSLMGCSSMFFSFVSIAYLPLALASAIGYISPIMVVPAAAIILRERPGLLVALAALAGFAGALVMLWPALTGPTLDIGTLIGVGAGFAMALTTVITKIQVKNLTATEPPATIAFYFALFCALVSLASFPFGWITPSWSVMGWLAGAGILGGLAHIALTEAVARAPVSALAPFEYTGLIWALGLDLVVFSHVPSTHGLVGTAMIVAAAAAVAFGDKLVPRKAA